MSRLKGHIVQINDSKDNIAIRVENVIKSFRLPHNKQSSVKGGLINLLQGDRSFEIQEVLKGVSLEIEKGEFFGIVGRNGSGKSTLLKLLAGIYTPTDGKVIINGSLTPFIELGVGFNPELTGRENTYLNGALLGFSRKEVDDMYDDIVSFSELERFMDQKLKNYSSGMQVRLAFSIAIRARSDILLLDEVLAVGDAAFQQKCYDYFAELKQAKKTVILVSHSMGTIERFCTKAMLLDKGKIVDVGDSSKIATLYENMFIEAANSKNEKLENSNYSNDVVTTRAVVLQAGKEINTINADMPFVTRIEFTMKKAVPALNIGINIRNSSDQIIFSNDMRRLSRALDVKEGQSFKIDFEIDNVYTNGSYKVDLHFVDESNVGEKKIFSENTVKRFKIMGVKHHEHSLVHPRTTIRIHEHES